MNKFICLARFTKDPETRYTTENMAVLRGRVAIPRSFKRDGEPDADFINVIAFGKNAENIQKYFTQGSPILIESHVQTGAYTNRDGQKVYTTDFVIDHWDFVGSKAENNAENKTGNKPVADGEFVPVPENAEELPWN